MITLPRIFLRKKRPRALAVLLCYNDGDILSEQIEYLQSQNHDIIVWDHGSDDCTSDVLDKYSSALTERKHIPRSFDFYNLYPAMSQNLIDNYVSKYDMISWPDQDEFLEGPGRNKDYYAWLTEVFNSRYSWMQFHNFVFWYNKDAPGKTASLDSINHYALFSNCSPRIRAWKAEATNIRQFNHNPPEGAPYPELFCLRHYPFRSEEHLMKRLLKDRAGLERNGMNWHYDNMLKKLEAIRAISIDQFHIDDHKSNLSMEEIFDWNIVYGREQ